MSKRRHYHVNRRKTWLCPYFRWDGDRYLSCDAGKPVLPNRETANEYMTAYCAGRWQDCTLAMTWNKYLEGVEDVKEIGTQDEETG